MSVVALADSPPYDSLVLIGVTVVKNPTGDELEELLARSKVVVVESSVYRRIRGKLEQALQKMAEPPLVVVAPSKAGEETGRFEEVAKRVYGALGVTGR